MIATTLVRALRGPIASLLAAAMLVACAPAPAPPPTATPPPASPVAREAPTPRPSPTLLLPTPTPAPRPLTLWVAEEGAPLEAARAVAAAAAERAGPIEVLARPPDGLRLSLATAELVGDPPPDLLWADGETLAGLVADGRLEAFPADAIPADTLPALRTAATAGGKVWGAPVAASGALLLMANAELVPQLPATSDELIVRSRAATTPEVAGLVGAWNEARWLLPWLHAFGGAPTSPDGQTVTLDTPAMTATLNLMRELYRAAPDDGDGYGRGRRLFAQGYAAIAIDGDWSLPMYRAVSDTLTLAVAPLPIVPATGRAATPVLGGTFLMLGRGLDGEALERGLAFAAYLAEPGTQARLAADLGRLPATREAIAAGGAWAKDPALSAAAALALEAPGLPPTVAARCALLGVDIWLPSLIKGSVPAEEIPGRMQREAEACVAREGP